MSEIKSSYFELTTFVENSTIDKRNVELVETMKKSAIKGFGWSVGLVIDTPEFAPKHRDRFIEAVIKTDESFDTWTLSAKGEFYMLKSLFEGRRDETAIFVDTRLVRLFETLCRVGVLYYLLGASKDSIVHLKLKFGGLQGKKLKVANQSNYMLSRSDDRVCDVDEFEREIICPLSDLIAIESLKAKTIKFCADFFQLFNGFELKEDISNKMILDHSVYKGVEFALQQIK